ncbi:class I SAM-dependent methyltransferase [bacterium]|nr:class I SAM-dependent methyltransferase [bacterium]
MNSQDVQNYWEQRLSQDYSLSGVGYLGLGRHFNQWMYRVRRWVFLRTLSSKRTQIKDWRVLDIGAGTGFYADCWRTLGCRTLSGVDITHTAVSNLKNKFPEFCFFQGDVGDEFCPKLDGQTFDAVSAMDVLFHIVEEERFERAIQRIQSCLKIGGWFFYSDNFLRTIDKTSPHQSSRSLAKIQEILTRNGLRVVSRSPMFWLMNAPVDSQNRWLWKFWSLLERIVSKHELLGYLAGLALFPLEIALVTVLQESPTTEIMICQKIPDHHKGDSCAPEF